MFVWPRVKFLTGAGNCPPAGEFAERGYKGFWAWTKSRKGNRLAAHAGNVDVPTRVHWRASTTTLLIRHIGLPLRCPCSGVASALPLNPAHHKNTDFGDKCQQGESTSTDVSKTAKNR